MDTHIPILYKQYGDYVTKSKMIIGVDGLLPVQRRVLLTTHLLAKTHIMQSSRILGENYGRFHPYALADGTITWAVLNGLVDGVGSFGNIIGVHDISASAPRYTSIKSNKLMHDMLFKYVNFVPWEEDQADKEPVYLPSMLPVALFIKEYISHPAFGYKPVIPTYKTKDIIKRLFSLIEGNENKPVIKPEIYGCKTLSSKEECRKLLETGEGIIDLQGLYSIEGDEIVVKGWKPGIKFKSLLVRIDRYKKWNLLTNKEIGWIDESSVDSDDEYFKPILPKVRFKVIKRDPSIFSKMKEAIEEKLKSRICFKVYIVKDGNIISPSIDQMLLDCFVLYSNAFKKYLEDKLFKLNNKLEENIILSKIKPIINKFKDKDIKEQITLIAQHIKEKEERIKEIVDKYSVSKLIAINVDISGIMNEINTCKSELSDINKSIIADYSSIYNQFGGK